MPCRAAGGVLEDVSDSVVAVTIPQGAHHLDLMFSHPSDSASLRAARQLEMRNVRRWIRQRNAAETNASGRGRVRLTAAGSGRLRGGSVKARPQERAVQA